jgi:hypothetical protein
MLYKSVANVFTQHPNRVVMSTLPIPNDRPPNQAGVVDDVKRRILMGSDDAEPNYDVELDTDSEVQIPASPPRIPVTQPEVSWLVTAGHPIDFSVVNDGFRINLKARLLNRHASAFLLILPITCGFEPALGAEFDATLGTEKLKLVYLDHYYEFKKDKVIIIGFQIIEKYTISAL